MSDRCTLIYIAGPMRGYSLWNAPAFDVAAIRLRKAGWSVVSPHDLDRANGLSAPVDGHDPGREVVAECLLRDLHAIAECEAVAVLKDWELSSGVRAELAFALAIGVEILDAETMEPLDMEGYFQW